jgi:hypothetical protein
MRWLIAYFQNEPVVLLVWKRVGLYLRQIGLVYFVWD